MSKLWINSLGEVGPRGCGFLTYSDDDIKKNCSAKEQALIKQVWAIQKAITTDRFRAYLGKGKKILLSTEFIYFSDEKEIAKGIRWLAESIGAYIDVMAEFEHLDKVTYDYDTPEAETVIGPDHGRLETQVEMVWVVATAREARLLVKMARKETQKLWENYGVSVL